ncbi:replication protein, partial [Salmonella enterica]
VVVYPESAPENWVEILDESRIQFAVSPLHDKDVNPDGEIKKSHWHVILCWDGPVTDVAVKKLTDKIEAPNPIKLESVRGAYRYFTHMDHPDKYQYDDKEIKVFNGFDISSYIALTKEERYEAITAIIRYINENKVTEYLDLLNELMTHDYSLFKVACDNTILFTSVIRSNRHKTDR